MLLSRTACDSQLKRKKLFRRQGLARFRRRDLQYVCDLYNFISRLHSSLKERLLLILNND